MDGTDLQLWSPTYYEAHTNRCKEFLNDKNNWQMVPLLNSIPLHNLTDHQLVRFQGMIQDMYNPEYFLKQYEVIDSATGVSSVRSGQYSDMALCKGQEQLVENSNHNINSERQTWYCISVPALNLWVTNYNTSHKPMAQQDHAADLQIGKRPAPEADDEVEISREAEPKRVCTLPGGGNSGIKNQSLDNLNLPVPDSDARACLLKVYDEHTSRFAVNDIVEVVGFISLDPSLSCDLQGEDDEDMDMETQVHNPPPSLVPRLHTLAINKKQHCNPLVTNATNTVDIMQTAAVARQDLRLVLSQLLLGDELAADYFICHLLSRVYLRTDLLVMGQLSLNLYNVPANPDYVSKLYSIVELLVPKSHCLPMSLDNLNKKTFIPKKDYSSNHLCSGLLQLSQHTHLVLDETALQPGQLDNNGVHNMSALGCMISQQKVSYDFQYYKLDFNSDIPVLVFSDGKSLLPCSVAVPLETDEACVDTLQETVQAAKHYLQGPLLDRIRVYLTVAKLAQYDMSPELQEEIQDDFVKLMNVNGKKTSSDDLHILMVLARLMSLSMGQSVLTEAAWKKSLSMEEQRKQRIASHSRQAPSQL